uniref:Deoxyribonuclease TATDN2 n=1 Tax=Pogona vitticeps TaxID=103695 RepID=A0A6J0THN8_9SAUR
MQPNRRRKLDWDSSSISLPTKYCKLTEDGSPHPSPNISFSGKKTAAFRKRQTSYLPESSYKEFPRASFTAEDSSSDEFDLDDEASSIVKEIPDHSLSSQTLPVKHLDCDMSQRNVIPESQECLKHKNKQDDCSDEGPSHTPSIEQKITSKEAEAYHGRRRVKSQDYYQGSREICRKALLGILGGALRTKREGAPPNGIRVERKETSDSPGNLKHFSEASKPGEQESGKDPHCPKSIAKDQINISISQSRGNSGSDGSSRHVSVISRSQKELQCDSRFKKTDPKEENITKSSAKEPSKSSGSLRLIPAIPRFEDEDEAECQLESNLQKAALEKELNASMHSGKAPSRSSGNSGCISKLPRVEDEPELQQKSSFQKTAVKKEHNISRHNGREAFRTGCSLRHIPKLSSYENDSEFQLKSTFQKAPLSNNSRHSGKEGSEAGGSSKRIIDLPECEDEPVLQQEQTSPQITAKEGISTTCEHSKKRYFREPCSSDSSVKNMWKLSQTEGKQKPEKECSKQQSKTPEKNINVSLSEKKSWRIEKHLRCVSEVPKDNGEEYQQDHSREKTIAKGTSSCTKQKNVSREKCASHSPFGSQNDANNDFVNFQRTVIVATSPKLVFVDEHDPDIDQKFMEPERESSVGSDWSDMEDVEPVNAFSQEDSIPNQSTTETMENSVLSTEFVMYPPHLYSSGMSDYAKYWISTPKPVKSPPFSSPSNDTSNASHLCDISGLSTGTPSNTSKDKSFSEESMCGKGRRHSYGSPWLCEKKNQRRSIEETSCVPIFSTSKNSDSSVDNYVNWDLPSDLPKYLEEGFIDTHCHLDMLYSKMAFRGTFSKFRETYDSTFPKEFQGCIADFCDPRTLNNYLWEDLLKEDMIWGAFGCHPHFARYYTDLHEKNILQAMRHPRAIAFGEMGLDYSYKCSTEVPKQHKVFERQLNLAVSLRKPLVIHCRDADDDLLDIMKKCVPKDYKIHRHCFTGSYSVIEPLLDYFPNLTVGFTALLTYPSANEARESVRKIPLNRIVVETDAPYFLPRQVPKNVCQYSHPGVALHTVKEIARLKEVPLSTMLGILRQNTNKIYNL